LNCHLPDHPQALDPRPNRRLDRGMKATLFALFVGLLMVGCGNDATPVDSSTTPEVPESPKAIDLDDKETRDKIIAEALDWDKLQKRGTKGEVLLYAPNDQTPYTGWSKLMYENGRIRMLAQFKDGKRDGLATEWHENGKKWNEANFKDGKLNGLVTIWYENGQKQSEGNCKDGKEDGLHIFYKEDGSEVGRVTYKDGELVKD
jgi:hypothetical protein